MKKFILILLFATPCFASTTVDVQNTGATDVEVTYTYTIVKNEVEIKTDRITRLENQLLELDAQKQGICNSIDEQKAVIQDELDQINALPEPQLQGE